jgi:hypothetical protein
LTANDSTSNGRNGTLGSATSAAAGQIDGAANVSTAINGPISIPAGSTTYSSFTISAWIKATSINSWAGIFFNRGGSNTWGMNVFYGTNLGYTWNNDSSTWSWNSGLAIPTGSWVYAVITMNNSTAGIAYLGSAGTLSSATNSYAPGTTQTDAGTSLIGQDSTDPTGREWNGLIDEVRVSNIVRSADWIATEYNNQSSPSTFLTFGAENTTTPPATVPIEVGIRNVQVIIKNAKVIIKAQ